MSTRLVGGPEASKFTHTHTQTHSRVKTFRRNAKTRVRLACGDAVDPRCRYTRKYMVVVVAKRCGFAIIWVSVGCLFEGDCIFYAV